jgi:hypothetical protein
MISKTPGAPQSTTFAADDASYWRELAEAFRVFVGAHPASAILVGISLKRPSEESVRLVVDQVGVLLGRWRDSDDKKDLALSLWGDLARPAAKQALATAVRDRFLTAV